MYSQAVLYSQAAQHLGAAGMLSRAHVWPGGAEAGVTGLILASWTFLCFPCLTDLWHCQVCSAEQHFLEEDSMKLPAHLQILPRLQTSYHAPANSRSSAIP